MSGPSLLFMWNALLCKEGHPSYGACPYFTAHGGRAPDSSSYDIVISSSLNTGPLDVTLQFMNSLKLPLSENTNNLFIVCNTLINYFCRVSLVSSC